MHRDVFSIRVEGLEYYCLATRFLRHFPTTNLLPQAITHAFRRDLLLFTTPSSSPLCRVFVG